MIFRKFFHLSPKIALLCLSLATAACNAPTPPPEADSTADRPSITVISPEPVGANPAHPLVELDGLYSPAAPLGKPQSVAATGETQEITVYTVDNRCETLLPQTVMVPKDSVLEGAVAAAIAAQSNSDFAIAGYRVSTSQSGQKVTVDFRLAPDSPRSFPSLSSCEQFALFGGIRETLLAQEGQSIKSVEFLHQGDPITY